MKYHVQPSSMPHEVPAHEVRVPTTKFEVQVISDREDTPDAARLCDSVDYGKYLQIRLEKNGRVACFWQKDERGEFHATKKMSFERFWDLVTPVLEKAGRKADATCQEIAGQGPAGR